MRSFSYFLILIFGLSSCVSLSPYSGGVTATTDVEIFNAMTDSNKTFIYALSPAMSLEDKYNFQLVVNALIDDGWRVDSSSKHVLSAQFSIDNGVQVTSNSPVFGQVPTGVTQKSSTVQVNPYTNSAQIKTTTTPSTVFGVTGYTSSTSTVYTRRVEIHIWDQERGDVWLCKMKSSGSTDNLTQMLPIMLSTLPIAGDESHHKKSYSIGTKSNHVMEFKQRIGAY